MVPVNQRAYLAASAAFYPALTLALAAGSLAGGKPVDGRAVVGFLAATALAGAVVGRLLRRQILLARGSKVVLVAILTLVVGTPLVVAPELLFGFSGLHGPLSIQEAVLVLLVVALGTSLNPVFWVAASGYVVLLRKAAERAGPAARSRAAPSPDLSPGGGEGPRV